MFIQVHVVIHLTASTNFDIIDYNSFWKIHCFTFFPYKSIRDQIWPCRKIGQGQPSIISWTNLVVLEHLILHTKFQGHRPFGSGEDFFKVFTIYGHGSQLYHVTRTVWTNFRSPSHGDSIWNLASICPVVSEEKMFKEYGRQTDGWWRPAYPISSPVSLWLKWAKMPGSVVT